MVLDLRRILVLAGAGFLMCFVMSLWVCMFIASRPAGIVFGVFWMASCLLVIFMAFFRNEDTQKKIIYCIIAGSGLIGSIVQIALDAKSNWHGTVSKVGGTAAYATICMCLGDLLALAFVQLNEFVLPDFLKNASVTENIATVFFAIPNLLSGFLVGICAGQHKTNVWSSSFAYTIVLWLVNAGLFVGSGFFIERAAGCGFGGGSMEGFKKADFDPPQGSGTYPPMG
jgi:hypothetical protein